VSNSGDGALSITERVMRLLVIASAFAIACGSSKPSETVAAPPITAMPAEEHHDHHPHEGADGTGAEAHRFAKADDWVKVFDDPARDAWQQPDKVVAALALAPGMTVADVGAGTGYFEARLATAVGAQGKVLAVDVEPDMVRYLTERAAREHMPNVTAVLATPDDPKLARASVDRILIIDTWHHISDRVSYAKKLATALRPGGFVLVVDFTKDTTRVPMKHLRIPPEQVVSELEQAGLAASIEPGLPDQFVVKGALK
jgi:SAM-dependent methyltransferase